MTFPSIQYCPGTLAAGHQTYSPKCLRKLFQGKKVDHVLPYLSPGTDSESREIFEQTRNALSISGVQEKFSLLLEGKKLRPVKQGERGSYILKPIPALGKRAHQMPANEHLTMQIAEQIYQIETAANALIFFEDGSPAYLTLRFDVLPGSHQKRATEDFASLAGRTPYTHGDNYKYQGNYLQLFELLKKNVTAYKAEAPRLLKIILFNYLFSNGDAHFKNFSLLETSMGDYRLSPAYDLLNSRIHVNDTDFALQEGLLPPGLGPGRVVTQFSTLARETEIPAPLFKKILTQMLDHSDKVEALIAASFLNDSTRRSYLQAYHGKRKQLSKS
jgi:serine/threonine-protein kinase HipA